MTGRFAEFVYIDLNTSTPSSVAIIIAITRSQTKPRTPLRQGGVLKLPQLKEPSSIRIRTIGLLMKVGTYSAAIQTNYHQQPLNRSTNERTIGLPPIEGLANSYRSSVEGLRSLLI